MLGKGGSLEPRIDIDVGSGGNGGGGGSVIETRSGGRLPGMSDDETPKSPLVQIDLLVPMGVKLVCQEHMSVLQKKWTNYWCPKRQGGHIGVGDFEA